MGIVIQFPEARRAACVSVPIENVGAPVVILPVIRIERHTDEIDIGLPPHNEPPAGNSRRRRRG